MPAPYSHDLRLRVMDAVCGGMTYEEVAQRFRVSNSTILRWVRRLRESGSYAALPMGGAAQGSACAAGGMAAQGARSRSCWPRSGIGCWGGSRPSRV